MVDDIVRVGRVDDVDVAAVDATDWSSFVLASTQPEVQRAGGSGGGEAGLGHTHRFVAAACVVVKHLALHAWYVSLEHEYGI